jgi:hypothetical protein
MWALVLTWGIRSDTVRQTETYLEPLEVQRDLHEQNVREFVVTGNKEQFHALSPADLPLPNARFLSDRITHPGIRGYLPAVVREPVETTTRTNHGFRELPPPGILPPKAAGTVRSTDGNGSPSWLSEPLAVDHLLTVLRFAVAGDSRLTGNSIGLLFTDGSIRTLNLNALPGHRWVSTEIRIPRGADSFQVFAKPEIEGAWLAFTSPVEVGCGSWIAGRARKSAPFLFWAGIAVLGSGLIWGMTVVDDFEVAPLRKPTRNLNGSYSNT